MTRSTKILILVTVSFIFVVISLGAGVTSLVLYQRVNRISQENQEAIAKVEALALELAQLRKEANTANCIAANVGRDAVREAVKDSLLALVPVGTVLDADQKARIALYNERVDAGLPFRDCSVAGIEKFLSVQPPDPALESPEVD